MDPKPLRIIKSKSIILSEEAVLIMEKLDLSPQQIKLCSKHGTM